jgi:hypothetical protein
VVGTRLGKRRAEIADANAGGKWLTNKEMKTTPVFERAHALESAVNFRRVIAELVRLHIGRSFSLRSAVLPLCRLRYNPRGRY